MRRVPWYVWALGAFALLYFVAKRGGVLTGTISAGSQSANPAAMANTPSGLIGSVSDGLAKVIKSISGNG